MEIPRTTETNHEEFIAAWRWKYGGSYQNAYRVWEVTYNDEHSRYLSKSHEPLLDNNDT